MNEPRDRFAALFAYCLAGATTILRLVLNHLRLFNISPIGPVGMFTAARAGWKHGLLASLGMFLISSIALWAASGFHDSYSPLHPLMAVSLLSYGLYIVLGRTFIGASNSPWRIGLAGLLGPIQFFLITNFGSWLWDGIYARTWEGLVECYLSGLAFNKWSLLAEMATTPLIFVVYALLPKPAEQPQEAPLPELQPER